MPGSRLQPSGRCPHAQRTISNHYDWPRARSLPRIGSYAKSLASTDTEACSTYHVQSLHEVSWFPGIRHRAVEREVRGSGHWWVCNRFVCIIITYGGSNRIGVVSATVNVLCELARHNPKDYLSFAPPLFHILTTSSNNWMLIKIIKLVCCNLPLV